MENRKIESEHINLVRAIASKFIGKSGLDMDDLVSAGLEGLAVAISKYDEGKGQTFRQYAGWCIRNTILSEINQNSRTVRINSYAYDKMKESGDMSVSFMVSIDRMVPSDSEDRFSSIDTILGLRTQPDTFKCEYSTDEDMYSELYRAIERRFKDKSVIIYKIFGVNGHSACTAREIGTEMGISEVRVSQTKKEIMDWIRSERKLAAKLENLIDSYNEYL